LEIGCCDLLDKRHAHRALGPGLCEQLRARGLSLLPIEAPEVRRPCGGEIKRSFDEWAADRSSNERRRQRCANCRTANAERWKLLSVRDFDLCLLFQNVLYANAHVIVV